MQRIEFNLQMALDGAKLVTRDGRDVTDFICHPNDKNVYRYCAIVSGMVQTYSDKGEFMVGRIDDLDLFLAVPYTDIIGNAITDPPMMTAEAWLSSIARNNPDKYREFWKIGIKHMMQSYGDYVADFINKNK